MTYVPNFPTNNTNINQSVGQIQSNWNFIQTSVGTDHFFNVGGVTEGHHRFVQLVSNGAIAAPISAGCVGDLYSRTTSVGAVNAFFINAAIGIVTLDYQIPLTILATFPTIAGGNTINNLFIFPGTPVMGSFLYVDQANPLNVARGEYFFNGAALTVIGAQVGGVITNVVGNLASIVITCSAPIATLRTKLTLSFL